MLSDPFPRFLENCAYYALFMNSVQSKEFQELLETTPSEQNDENNNNNNNNSDDNDRNKTNLHRMTQSSGGDLVDIVISVPTQVRSIDPF